MGVYRPAIVTACGQNLIARALSGVGIVRFTHARTSNCRYPPETELTALTELQDIQQSAEPFSAETLNDTVVQVGVRFENADVEQAYLIETIGVYAQIGDEEEILFSVIRADAPDQMPAKSPISPSAFIYNIQTAIQQANQIHVTVNPAGAATVEDIRRLQEQIREIGKTSMLFAYDAERKAIAFQYAGGSITPGTGSPYILPVATATTLGGVRIGEGVDVQMDGTISINSGELAETAASLVEENAEEFSEEEIDALFTLV